MTEIISRKYHSSAVLPLLERGLSASFAKIFAARGITDPKQLDYSFAELLPFLTLKNAREMAIILADAITEKKKLMVIADYDADGATACAVAIRGLRAFGAIIDFLVPNRFEYGYGLTPEIVRLAAQSAPEILITVDNGIASVEGVTEANRLGMQVLITDHHLPGETLPDATCIVNPNQLDCPFPSKNLAGVGVMFYVLLALRAEFRMRGKYSQNTEPKLTELLDLVALGTIADVVKLDQNNRILVQQGLQRIRAGLACKGIIALLKVAKKNPSKISSLDLGFSIGPRLNAAGRMDDMSLGINCLLTDDPNSAIAMANSLNELNQERRNIESDMQESALGILENINPANQFSLVLFDESWHQGVIGILASRLKDKFHRPTIIFARSGNGEIKGSGRSISGLHLRDTLDLVSKRNPGLINKFGGHAAAAGLTISVAKFEDFVSSFENVCSGLLSMNELAHCIETDGTLDTSDMNLEVARLLEAQVWGQGFPAPQFDDYFFVQSQRVVGERHLKLQLRQVTNTKAELKDGFKCMDRFPEVGKNPPFDNDPTNPESLSKELDFMMPSSFQVANNKTIDAILFGYNLPLPDHIRAVFSLSVNEYNDHENLQLIIRHWQQM